MKNTTLFDIRFASIIKVLLTIFLVWLIIQLKTLIIVLFIAFIIAVAIRPVVKMLQKYKIPRGVSVAVIYIALISFIIFAIYLIAKPLASELIGLANNLPSIVSDLQKTFPILAGIDVQNYINNLSSNLNSSGSNLSGSIGTALKTLSGFFDIFTSLLTIIVISIYLTLGLDRIIDKLKRFVPKQNRERVLTNYYKIEEQVGAWLRGQIFLMILIGILTYIILKILGIPFALPLALFAGFMEILPIIGPIVYSGAIILVALTVSPLVAVLSVIACLIIQQVEGNLLVPQIMKRAVGISPITTIIAVIAGGTLLGVIGALLAVPIAAILSALIEDLYAQKD